jgi:hypothetical protein
VKGFDLVFLRHIRFSLGNVMKFDAELPILEFSGFVRQGSCRASSRRLLEEGSDDNAAHRNTPNPDAAALRNARLEAFGDEDYWSTVTPQLRKVIKRLQL